jgi:RND family efflux transporter MFP subunit
MTGQTSQAGLERPRTWDKSMRSFVHCALTIVFLSIASLQPLLGQAIELTPVVSKPLSRTIDLPGEFQPFLSVALNAKVTGYVEKVLVDRGSVVKEGQLLVELIAPEMEAQIAEAQAKVESAEADRVQAEAQLAAAENTFQVLTAASKTPGAIAGNELVQSEKQVQAGKALVNSRQHAVQAAQSSVNTFKTIESYLKVTAPFDGVVTARLIHPGALVGPNSGTVLLELQQVSTLRLVVAVPEENVGGMVRGTSVVFSVPAYPGRTFSGKVARIAQALDPKTRSMPVELDVINKDQMLAPGMYPTVRWPVRSSDQGLFVPKTSVVTTTERTFVILDKDGRAEWMDVQKGPADGDLIRVTGSLKAGDLVVKRATDEIRPGTPLKIKS